MRTAVLAAVWIFAGGGFVALVVIARIAGRDLVRQYDEMFTCWEGEE